jgi:crotonobetainyl-CoA:carnitine CoA-transferase CaiB-like acyl-CoA transferase
MMLKGLKIVEMATYIAAPAAAGIMADWGAEIIKIEPRGGDPIRQFFDNAAAKDNRGNPIFDLDNRSKRSVSIDVSTPEGQALVRRLIAGADVFITNTRPQSLIRAGLDYESLKADFPKLIYGCVTGYGMEGAERDRPGFDMAAFWARSGMADHAQGARTDADAHRCWRSHDGARPDSRHPGGIAGTRAHGPRPVD